MENCLESMILHGCNLAKILEHDLPNQANQPDILVKSCEEIVSVFRNVRETVLSVGQMGVQELHGYGVGGGIREHAMASLDARAIAGVGSAYIRRVDYVPESSEMKGMLLQNQRPRRQLCLEFMMFGEMSGVGGDIMDGSRGGIGGQTPLDFSSASYSPNQGRRKNDVDKVVKKVAAPQMGNNETPPEDGFKWKKYGQKEILGHSYPRSYYICTQQKLRNCPAKKQVQRLDNEPFIFEVTYRNKHICRVPSASDAVPVLFQPSTAAQSPPLPPFPTSLMATTQFLSANIFRHLGGIPASSGGVEAGSSGGRRQFDEFQQVADMADAMFNSGISRSNSMDLIFSSLDDHNKWDSTEEASDLIKDNRYW